MIAGTLLSPGCILVKGIEFAIQIYLHHNRRMCMDMG